MDIKIKPIQQTRLDCMNGILAPDGFDIEKT
jgi:hypothetical protein